MSWQWVGWGILCLPPPESLSNAMLRLTNALANGFPHSTRKGRVEQGARWLRPASCNTISLLTPQACALHPHFILVETEAPSRPVSRSRLGANEQEGRIGTQVYGL